MGHRWCCSCLFCFVLFCFGFVLFVCLSVCLLVCVRGSSVASCICKWFDFHFSDLRNPLFLNMVRQLQTKNQHIHPNMPTNYDTTNSKQFGLGLIASHHFGLCLHMRDEMTLMNWCGFPRTKRGQSRRCIN